MDAVAKLFENNRRWAAERVARDPGFFARLAEQQSPAYVWIGCSDSRVPATEICGLLPGEMFVHRNVANVVVHTDLNCLAALQYAVQVLRVRHVIVCGHYGCGGVRAALADEPLGLVDDWIAHVKDVARAHRARLAACRDDGARADLLGELNVAQQVENVARTTILRDAWDAGQPVAVHGWIYRVSDGILRDLEVTTRGPRDPSAVERVLARRPD
ncbi:MAG TPA: carbonate dehydratase [Candidatus Binatia bacterium]|jgi:carbonic anhydrase|nr:carbonate dehydratase [Candidatus Binatia bacterium]